MDTIVSSRTCHIVIFIIIVSLTQQTSGIPVRLPPYVQKIVYNVSDINNLFWDPSNPNLNKSFNLKCHLRAVDKTLHSLVTTIIERKAKIIEYDIQIKGNYTTNPLLLNQTWTYKGNKWARVGSSHGQTILNLAFNYGILSLMTLSFGVEKLTPVLEEIPMGCLSGLTEDEKVQAVFDVVLRDFKEGGDIVVFEGESSVCHQIIKEEIGQAKFTDRCCYEARDGKDIVCVIDIPNKWLHILDILLASLTVCVFIFGPAAMPDWLYTATLDNIQYYVKLKEPLYKTLCICRRETDAHDITAKHVINLRNHKDYEKCRRILGEIPAEMIIPIKITQYDINISYRKLLVENNVPVGIISSISRAIFMCKLKEMGPFHDCCEAPICGCLSYSDKPTPWKSVCSLFGRILLVFFLPLPFYMRLLLYYGFEHPEIESRQIAAEKLNLDVYYNFRLMQYLTPLHPLYLSVYVVYFLAGFTLAYLSGKDRRTHFQQAVMNAFKDMKNDKMLNAFGMLVNNCLWPFKKFGIFGIFIGIFLWPVLLPMSLLACVVYCIPLVFLTIRIFYHTFNGPDDNTMFNQSLADLKADTLLRKIGSKSNLKKAKEGICYSNIRLFRIIINAFLTTMALLTLYAMMVMVAEVCGFLAEVMCFTMMGLIVNAAKVLKYGSLLFLVIVYSHDCFNNVNKKYLKLNKALFSEVRGRLGKDIEEYTQLPDDLQENRGFKACEASDQAEYESVDDISKIHPFSWDINDMILFIDNKDTPRIPKKLFDQVCSINVAGSPGPVYLSLLQATGKFMVIILFLVFVLIVVMSFGESYNISSSNQMLATMAGGFMPFIFSNVLKPAAPDVETNLLSFRSKVEEIVKNFWQTWPMYDFLFEIGEEPKSESESEDEDEDHFDDAQSEAKTDFTVKTDKTHKTEKSDKSGSKKKEENGKDKDKKEQANGIATFMKTKEIKLSNIKNEVENIELKPAENQEVDILIYISDSDQEWLMEWSSFSKLDKQEYESPV